MFFFCVEGEQYNLLVDRQQIIIVLPVIWMKFVIVAIILNDLFSKKFKEKIFCRFIIKFIFIDFFYNLSDIFMKIKFIRVFFF